MTTTIRSGGYAQIPRSGQLGSGSPVGAIRGTPGYLVSDGGPIAPSLDDLAAAYFGIGGPEPTTNAYLVTANEAIELCGFDPTRASCEIYCDDSSSGPVYIGGAQVAPVNGQTQPNAGLRINPGTGRIYDGADRARRLWAICGAGVSALVVVVLTPNSNVA